MILQTFSSLLAVFPYDLWTEEHLLFFFSTCLFFFLDLEGLIPFPFALELVSYSQATGIRSDVADHNSTWHFLVLSDVIVLHIESLTLPFSSGSIQFTSHSGRSSLWIRYLSIPCNIWFDLILIFWDFSFLSTFPLLPQKLKTLEDFLENPKWAIML